MSHRCYMQEDSNFTIAARWVYPPVMLVDFNGLAVALIAGDAQHLLPVPLLVAAVAVSFAVATLPARARRRGVVSTH